MHCMHARPQVNSRLAEVERKYKHSTSGDPAFPKQQWPFKEACPLCRQGPDGVSPVTWDRTQLLAHLRR